MKRMTKRRIGVLLLVLALGSGAVISADSDDWKAKLDQSLRAWIATEDAGQRTVFLHLQEEALSGLAEADASYGSASHAVWASDFMSDVLDGIAEHAELAPSPTLLRGGSAIWEQGLPYLHGYEAIVVRCTVAGVEALGRLPFVARLSAADGEVAWPETVTAEAARKEGVQAIASPGEILASGEVSAAALAKTASSLGWQAVSRDAILADLDGMPASLGATELPVAGTLRFLGFGQPSEASGIGLEASVDELSWAPADSPPLTTATLASLSEGFAQTDAGLALLTTVALDDEVFPLQIFLGLEGVAGAVRAAAPTSVLATRGSHEARVELLWDEVTGVQTYEILRRPRFAGAFEQLALTGSPVYSDADVEVCQQYEYVVRALGESVGLESQQVMGYVGLVPFTVENVWWNEEATGGLRIEWTPSASATHYRLLRSEPMQGHVGPTAKQYVIADELVKPWFLDTDIVAGQIYQYRVAAMNGCGRAEQSTPIRASAMFTPAPSGPDDPPYKIEASRGEPFEWILITWSAVPGVETYRVLRASAYMGTYEEIAVVTGRSFEDVSAEHCVDYWYRVQTVHEGGEGRLSAVAHGIYGYRTHAPQEVTATVGTYPDAIRLSW
ncbi:MAG: hypothetical protein JSW65_02735, partial [Candidatus Bipolaricaulota bacterium]